LSDLWRASAATASMAIPASDAAVYMPTRPQRRRACSHSPAGIGRRAT
jgi:hypothetical protein